MINLMTMMVAAALGACLRAYISQLSVFKNKDMPYGTIAVNIAGAFLMGMVAIMVAENTQYLIIAVGFRRLLLFTIRFGSVQSAP